MRWPAGARALLVALAAIAVGWAWRAPPTALAGSEASADARSSLLLLRALDERKVHANKYSQFSNNKPDPLDNAVSVAHAARLLHTRQESIRGTTIPTADGSNAAAGRRNRTTDAMGIPPLQVVPNDPSTYGYSEVGRVIGAHGVKGEVKVVFCDPDASLAAGSVLYLKKPCRRAPRPIVVVAARRLLGNSFLVSLENVHDRGAARALSGYGAFMLRADRPPLQPDEFTVNDIVGCKCFVRGRLGDDDAVAVVVGVVLPEDLWGAAAAAARGLHGMLEVRLLGSRAHCLIPFVPEIVPEVDVAQRKVVLDPPHGLLDLTYELPPKAVVRAFLPAAIGHLSNLDRATINAHTRLVFPAGGAHVPFV